MSIMIGMLLVVVSLAVVAHPFFSGRREAVPVADEAERLRHERERVYGLIDDLETDLQAGAVTDEEYRKELRELRIAAARIMRAERQVRPDPAADDLLEQEIAAARRARVAHSEEAERL